VNALTSFAGVLGTLLTEALGGGEAITELAHDLVDIQGRTRPRRLTQVLDEAVTWQLPDIVFHRLLL